MKNLKYIQLKSQTVYFILLIVVFIALGFSVGWWSHNFINQQPNIIAQYAIRESGYQFISPLLIGQDSIGQDQSLKLLEDKFREGTYDILNDPGVYTVSVYFRDLTNAYSMGIREDDLYDSGSLLKVSMLIAALKEAESEPGFLSKEITYPGQAESNKNIQFFNLKPGNIYTIEELLNIMITQSDNSAKDLLFATINRGFIDDVFQKLGLPVPNPNASYKISPKTYSYFFRVLYNATYLNRHDSEFAMELLNKTDYKFGLVAGIPQNISVAHKYGQYDTGAIGNRGSEVWELHDCGVVYYPNRPYFLCAMTRGENLEKLTEIIRKTSQIVYQEADNNFR